MDLSALASSLPQIAQIAGVLMAHGSGPSTAGALAGLGDVQHERNQRAYEGIKAYADQLEKMGMDTENWSEPAREAIMQERLNMLSPKTVSKVYGNPGAVDKLMSQSWERIRQASARPSLDQQTEQNAAAGQMQSGQQLQDTGAAAGGFAGTGMPGSSSLGLLGDTVGGAGKAMAEGAQSTLSQPTRYSYGPLTPGEKAQRAYAGVAPFLNGGASGGGVPASGGGVAVGGGGNVYPIVGFSGGKAHVNLMPKPVMSRPFTNPSDSTGRVVMAHRGLYDPSGQWFDEQNNPLGPEWVETGNYGTRTLQTTGANGQPVTQVQNRLATGQTNRFMPPHVRMVPQTDGSLWNVVTDGATGREISRYPVGMRFAAEIDRQLRERGLQGKELDNTKKQVQLQGYATMADGSTFVPNGMPTNANGPIAPIAGAHGYPTMRQLGKASAAVDLHNTVAEMKEIAPQLVSHFGLIRGNIEDWANQHGQALSMDAEGKELIGRWIALQRSVGGFAANAHNFFSSDFAKRIEDMAGSFGQNFEFDQGKLDGLMGVSKEIIDTNTQTLMPTAKPQGKLKVRKPGTGTDNTKPKQTTTGSPMQDLRKQFDKIMQP